MVREYYPDAKDIETRTIKLMGRIWRETSRDYAASAYGNVKVFIAGAGRNDVFRSVELDQYIDNPNVQTINGVARTKLMQIRETAGIDRVSRTLSLALVRDDMQQALRTGNRDLIRNALDELKRYEDQIQFDRGERKAKSAGVEQQEKAELARRADRLAALRQTDIRAEALSEIKAYISQRLQSGHTTQEQAEKMMGRAEQSVQDPQKAYRMRELARLKRTRDNAIRGEPDTQGINNYLNGKERYEKDVRAIRQAGDQHFAASNPADRQINRHNHQRLFAGHADLKRRNRRGEIKDYARAESELDQNLQTQLMQENQSTIRPRTRRTRTHAASHRP